LVVPPGGSIVSGAREIDRSFANRDLMIRLSKQTGKKIALI
jgi:hypothetical protein